MKIILFPMENIPVEEVFPIKSDPVEKEKDRKEVERKIKAYGMAEVNSRDYPVFGS